MPIFMFTDIEGSTRLWDRHPEAMGQVLARHDAILQKLIEKYGGSVIKHMGDGMFAVFEGGEPVRCALEIQKQLRKEDWSAVGVLHVRIALHAGDAEKRGEDYFGPVVNRAARILAMGWGGQILLTPEVVKASGLPAQATLQDLGVHRLKDLREPQRILGLVHPDLVQQRFSSPRVLVHPVGIGKSRFVRQVAVENLLARKECAWRFPPASIQARAPAVLH
jgi:class 3 adenylate cyclase